jgi:thiol-disulfide isomerase/thioredoxin
MSGQRAGRRVATVLVGLVLTGVAVAGCSGSSSVVDQSVDNSLGFQTGDGAVVYNAHDRKPVGDVSGTTLTGARTSLASLRGKVVVVNFWQSICGPCRGEASGFDAVAKEDASKGVAFLGIDVRDDRAGALAYQRAHDVPYPSIFDPGALLGLQFHGSIPATTPTTIVVDRTGKIAAKVSGALDYTHLRSLVAEIMAQPT